MEPKGPSLGSGSAKAAGPPGMADWKEPEAMLFSPDGEGRNTGPWKRLNGCEQSLSMLTPVNTLWQPGALNGGRRQENSKKLLLKLKSHFL